MVSKNLKSSSITEEAIKRFYAIFLLCLLQVPAFANDGLANLHICLDEFINAASKQLQHSEAKNPYELPKDHFKRDSFNMQVLLELISQAKNPQGSLAKKNEWSSETFYLSGESLNLIIGNATFIPNSIQKIELKWRNTGRVQYEVHYKDLSGNPMAISKTDGLVGLTEYLYKAPEGVTWTPFKQGQFVYLYDDDVSLLIGKYDSSTEFNFKIIDGFRKGEDFTFKPGLLATFLESHGDRYSKVLVRYQVDGKVVQSTIVVPTKQVRHTKVGHPDTLNAFLKEFDKISLEFSHNQLVRYRAESGEIETGKYQGLDKSTNRVLISTTNGNRWVSSTEVFHSTAGSPHTPSLSALLGKPGSFTAGLSPDTPSGPFRKLLNALAKVSSTPEYQQLDSISQIKVISKVINKVMKYRDSRVSPEFQGLRSFNDLICIGEGVCRHLAPSFRNRHRRGGVSF